MNQQHVYKQCPQCQKPASLEQKSCDGCGHLYKTDWSHRTQVVPPPPQYTAPPQYQTPYQTKSCPRCQQALPMDAAFCGRCGQDQRQIYSPYAHQVENRDDIQMAPGNHSAGVALFLALLVIGVGQMYNRQVIKGVVFLLIALIAVPASAFILWLPLALLTTIDAYCIGKKLAVGKRVGQWEMF